MEHAEKNSSLKHMFIHTFYALSCGSKNPLTSCEKCIQIRKKKYCQKWQKLHRGIKKSNEKKTRNGKKLRETKQDELLMKYI